MITFFRGKKAYMLNEDITQNILSFKPGQLKRKYYSSMHPVCSITSHGLHIKQKPNNPCLEYAIGSLMHRLFNHGPPPSELVKMTIKQPGKDPITYPVLISRTVEGETLKSFLAANPANKLCLKQLTEMQISQLLTQPGDGVARNFIVEKDIKKLICVDNDLSFIEPFMRLTHGTKKLSFSSILFMLEQKPLQEDVIANCLKFDPFIILNHWILDVIQREKAYTSLFTDEEQTQFWEEDPDNRFSPLCNIPHGNLAKLYGQIVALQQHFSQHPTTTPLELLSLLK